MLHYREPSRMCTVLPNHMHREQEFELFELAIAIMEALKGKFALYYCMNGSLHIPLNDPRWRLILEINFTRGAGVMVHARTSIDTVMITT